jgi:hypothetical protein
MPTIKIGGEDRPVKYTLNAVIEFEELTGIDVTKGSPDFAKISSMRALAYVGLKHGAKAENKEFTASLEDVGGWIGFGDGSVVEFIKAFQNDGSSGNESTSETEEGKELKK